MNDEPEVVVTQVPLSMTKELVKQFFADHENVTGVGIGSGGTIRVSTLRPMTTQLHSVNGVDIEYAVVGPVRKQEEDG